MRKTLDAQTETQVVAYIARGDTYDDILSVLSERGIVTSKATLSHIKTRNADALAAMQKSIETQQISHATSILKKSRELLERKLDKQLKLEEELTELRESHEKHEIDLSEYLKSAQELVKQQLTASELNSITKESFNQSQVEQGKPSSITETPAQAKQNLQRVLSAIAAGDDQAAVEAIFIDA